MINKIYNVTGHEIKASFSERDVENIFEPLLETLRQLRKEKNERIIVYLAAPPGAGKTTLSLFLKELYDEKSSPYSFQSASMDGFHHNNAYLKSQTIMKDGQEVSLKKYKGIPETFDLKAFEKKIIELKENQSVNWPTYDRALHDVSKVRRKVDADIVLIEGNYLLLNKEGWRSLKKNSDYTLFIDAKIDRLKKRLIDRKQLGGASFEEAVRHYKNTDKVNAEWVLTNSLPADLHLYLNHEGFSYSKVDTE